MYGIGTSKSAPPRPAWGVLYASVALALGLLVMVELVIPTGSVRTALEIIAVLVLMAAMLLWVRRNRSALELLGRRDGGWREVPIDAPPSGAPADGPSPARHRGGRLVRIMTDSQRVASHTGWRDRRHRFTVPSMLVRGVEAHRAAAPRPATKVADVMTVMPLMTCASASADEAAELMLQHNVGGLPVVDCGRLVGVITQADLVARLARRERRGWWRVLVDHERLARECQRISGSTVGEVMGRPAIVVAAGDAIEVAAELLDAHAIGRLPVLDHGGVVGIVSRSDVLRALGRGRPTRRCPDEALAAQLGGRGAGPARLGFEPSSEAGIPGGRETRSLGRSGDGGA